MTITGTKDNDLDILEKARELAYPSMSPQQLEKFEELLDYLKNIITNNP